MKQDILILTKDIFFGNALKDRLLALLSSRGIEERTVRVQPDREKILAHYNVIVITNDFCGDVQETATFIRRLRKVYSEPLIALKYIEDRRGLFPMQVAGCNFVVQLEDPHSFHAPDLGEIKENDWYAIGNHLDKMIGYIYEELAQPYQKT